MQIFLADSQESRHLVRPVTYNCDDESSMYDEMNSNCGIVYSGKSLVYRGNRYDIRMKKGTDRILSEGVPAK